MFTSKTITFQTDTDQLKEEERLAHPLWGKSFKKYLT